MKRTIITIDEAKCDGCGICVDSCMEGALKMIDGKAKLISDLYCDGLGACIKECPQNAIRVEQREAVPYSESAVMDRISELGSDSVIAHIRHLLENGHTEYVNEALEYISVNNIDIDIERLNVKNEHISGGCPGTKQMNFTAAPVPEYDTVQPSALTHWPVQLHLLNPEAPYFKDADVILTADCAAYSVGDFHRRFLKGKKLAIACPKLDSNLESYIEKLGIMIAQGGIKTLTVIVMEVPCCSGLIRLAQYAMDGSERKVPLKVIVVSVQGDIKMEKVIG